MHQLEMEVAAEEAELKMADVPSVALLNPIQTPVSPKALHVEKPSTEKTTTCEPPKNSEADTALTENDKTIEGKTNDTAPEVTNGPVVHEVAPSIDGVGNEITTKPEEKGSQSDITGTTVVAKETISAESQNEAGQVAIMAGTWERAQIILNRVIFRFFVSYYIFIDGKAATWLKQMRTHSFVLARSDYTLRNIKRNFRDF